MSNNKQTAVEWLEEQLISSLGIELTKHQKRLFNDVFIKQAKEMEKQQIIDANEDASTNELGEFLTGEQYYNQEYAKTSNN